jgi:osmoprotectant transport system ATP-binding protein
MSRVPLEPDAASADSRPKTLAANAPLDRPRADADSPRTGARVELRELCVRHGERLIVDHVNLTVEPGELLVLIGPSGAGKSSLLSTLNRLIEPASGEVSIDGRPIQSALPHELRRGIGYCFQGLGLFPHLNVAENIGMTPRLLGWERQRIEARVHELMATVSLDENLLQRLPHQLSGGQAQRVAVARALAAHPRLLLLDEPFGALDPATRARLQEELRALQSALGTTTLFVSHDLAETLLLADRIAVLDAGKLVQHGTPADIIARPATAAVSQLIEPALRRAHDLWAFREGS